MVDLTNILGGPWSPPAGKRVDPPEQQLCEAMTQLGLTPPREIHFDGKIHRFNSGTKGQGGHGDKTGWYLVFGDGIPAGRFGCWRSGVETTWCADVGRKLSDAESMAHARRVEEARKLRDAELARQREAVAETVEQIWINAHIASAEHPYLAKKGIDTHGARVTGDGRLVVPLYDGDGQITSLQYIGHDGGKLYHTGGKTGGCFWMIGAMDSPGVLYIAEGFATAATIFEVTGRPCVVAYSASNLVPVSGIMREKYGAQQSIVVVADNDKSGTGQKYADQASAKYGVRVVTPPIEGMDANDYAKAGNDLASLLNPKVDKWLIKADEFCAQPAPIAWLVKNWLQSDALIMVHGPSGGGKTFVVLDWCLRMASGAADWCGLKVKRGDVVYLAGEGHYGLRGRIAAWKAYHNAGALSMWLSKDGCDLNTPAGYMRAAEQIRALSQPPSIIVVDTLHRFLLGDENSAQDAKTMLDACNGLMREFGCSVILVHHTGVSDEAQHRARGSSAWRGALDIEISVVPGKASKPMQIIQRKSKDAEAAKDVFLELKSVEIPGWLDEEGAPVTSAIVIEADAPAPEKKESKIGAHKKMFSNAWFDSGCEEIRGAPYVSRSALLHYLTTKMGIKEATAQQYIKPGKDGKFIADLLLAEIIEAEQNGFVVINGEFSTALILDKSGERLTN